MRQINAILVLCFALFFTASCVSKKKFTALETERNSIASTLEQTEEKVKMLEEEKTELTTAKNQLETTLTAREKEVAEYTTRVNDLKKDLEEKEIVVKELEENMEVVDEAFSGVEKTMKEKSQAIEPLDDRLYLVLENPINFRTGSARLSSDSKEVIEKIADVLGADSTLHFVVEGHTDHRPISNAQYRDNWELSVARSLAIARRLVKLGVKPEQLTVAGRSSAQPKMEVKDDTPKSELEKNRRIEIYVFPSLGKLYQMRNS